MTCDCCTAAREAPEHRMHDPRCAHCGARLIQRIQRYPITRAEASQRCRAVLADWGAQGHSEDLIRKLARGPRALAPQSSSAPAKSGGSRRE